MSSELKIIWKRKINLDITYSCSLKCFNCSRLCNLPQINIKPLTPEDVQQFISDSKKLNINWGEIVINGGEPTVHKDFIEIATLAGEFAQELKCRFSVFTNGYQDLTKKLLSDVIKRFPKAIIVNTEKSPEKLEHHFQMTIAPVDVNFFYEDNNPCPESYQCGISLNSNGYFVCSPAAAIDGMFNLNQGIKHLADVSEIELRNRGNKLCKYCGMYLFAMGITRLGQFDYQAFSPTWQKLLWTDELPSH